MVERARCNPSRPAPGEIPLTALPVYVNIWLKTRRGISEDSYVQIRGDTLLVARNLVIVESPAKAKTIKKFLGRGYDVESSMGHVRDLPAKEFGIDIEKGFKPTYRVLRGRASLVKKLAEKARKSDAVYLAPDRDREGEAIAWHLAEVLRLPEEKTHRVSFNEITRSAIQEAFKHPGHIDKAKVDAQQARRILDRIVGYKLSPLLWKKVARGLSAGRVQSVAVKMVVDREREIEAFQPKEYWKLTATLSPQEGPQTEMTFAAELKKVNGEKFEPGNEEEAKKFLPGLQQGAYTVAKLRKRVHKSAPAAPFNTSSLQQQAANVLGFSARRTMMLAQQLYEGIEVGEEGAVGLITYMRTDSFRISEEAVNECREYIGSTFGERYLSSKPRAFASRRGAQEAHEAIRPTSVLRTPEKVKPYLEPAQYKLYDLIWRRFVATQMASAEYQVTEVEIRAVGEADGQPLEGLFAARGRLLQFDGHTKVSGQVKSKEQDLPAMEVDDSLKLHKLDPTQHFTKPPARYTEAGLVKALEKEGIGRPSTYATIISTIQERGYTKQKDKKFYATELGKLVTDKLVAHFGDIVDTGFTSRMEEQLDKIEEARTEYLEVLRSFYDVFSADMEKAEREMEKYVEESDQTCDQCGRPMLVRMSKNGRFLACSGFPQCRNTMPLNEEGQPEKPEKTEHACPKCGAPMVIKSGPRGRFLACSAYPECKYTARLTPEGEPAHVEETDLVCDKCGAPMVIRTGRRGKFAGCSAYPKCRNTMPVDENGNIIQPVKVDEKCEKCGADMVLRSGRRGKFLACSAYPKCRNTRPAPPDSVPQPEPTDIKCDKCGREMVIRHGTRGRFLACSGYPECRNTAPIPADDTEPVTR